MCSQQRPRSSWAGTCSARTSSSSCCCTPSGRWAHWLQDEPPALGSSRVTVWIPHLARESSCVYVWISTCYEAPVLWSYGLLMTTAGHALAMLPSQQLDVLAPAACAGCNACSGGTSRPAIVPTPARPHGHVQRAGRRQRRQRRRSLAPTRETPQGSPQRCR